MEKITLKSEYTEEMQYRNIAIKRP